MKTLTPEQVIAEYHSTLWVKKASTKIKIIDEVDMQRETSFFDLEGREHKVILGRCICVGSQGERWTCSIQSLERDRYPITEPDAQGYREYQMKQPQPIHCFDIPCSFTLLRNGRSWQCESVDGGIITWNGEAGEGLDMRVVARDAFLATYEQTTGER